MLLNVHDYSSPQAALDAATDGDRVYFPGLYPYTAPAGGWTVVRSLEIFGDTDGLGGPSSGTVLKPAGPNDVVFKLVAPVLNVYLHDLQLLGTGSAGTGVGILCQTSATSAAFDLRFRRLFVSGFGSHGIHLQGTNAAAGRIARVSMLDCTVRACGGAGVRMVHAYDTFVMGCRLEDNQHSGLAAVTSGVALYQCEFDGNALAAGLGANDGNLRLDDCLMARVDACRFLNFHLGSVKKACVLVGCGGGMVAACYFEAGAGSGREGIVVTGAGAGPMAILSSRFKNTDTLVRVDAGARDCILFPQYDESGAGAIVLPSPNEGMYGAPHVNRPAGNLLSGLLVPSSGSLPTEGLRDGMLFYHTGCHQLRTYADGAWRVVEVQP